MTQLSDRLQGDRRRLTLQWSILVRESELVAREPERKTPRGRQAQLQAQAPWRRGGRRRSQTVRSQKRKSRG